VRDALSLDRARVGRNVLRTREVLRDPDDIADNLPRAGQDRFDMALG
jgi:hypothetical protein